MDQGLISSYKASSYRAIKIIRLTFINVHARCERTTVNGRYLDYYRSEYESDTLIIVSTPDADSSLSRRVTDQGVEYYRSKGDISQMFTRVASSSGLGCLTQIDRHFELPTSRLRTAPTESTFEWPAVYFTCPLFRERPRRSRCDKSRSEGNRKLALYQDARSTNRANFQR